MNTEHILADSERIIHRLRIDRCERNQISVSFKFIPEYSPFRIVKYSEKCASASFMERVSLN